MVLVYPGINRNIMECKGELWINYLCWFLGINRNIMECKWWLAEGCVNGLSVLIET